MKPKPKKPLTIAEALKKAVKNRPNELHIKNVTNQRYLVRNGENELLVYSEFFSDYDEHYRGPSESEAVKALLGKG